MGLVRSGGFGAGAGARARMSSVALMFLALLDTLVCDGLLAEVQRSQEGLAGGEHFPPSPMIPSSSSSSFSSFYSIEPWSLHDLSSPVFLRHFPTPVSWLEAEEICQRHFGHLVRDGSGNEATLHDFLSSLAKEQEEEEEASFPSNQHSKPRRGTNAEMWIGLYQNSPSERFHWVDDVTSRPLVGLRTNPGDIWSDFNEDPQLGMCVSMDPDRAFRWNTRYCNGPDKASFVCQVPVPRWLYEGNCNLSLWINQPESDAILLGVDYYPHNDTAHILYQEDETKPAKVKTCSFTENYLTLRQESPLKTTTTAANSTTGTSSSSSSSPAATATPTPAANNEATAARGSANLTLDQFRRGAQAGQEASAEAEAEAEAAKKDDASRPSDKPLSADQPSPFHPFTTSSLTSASATTSTSTSTSPAVPSAFDFFTPFDMAEREERRESQHWRQWLPKPDDRNWQTSQSHEWRQRIERADETGWLRKKRTEPATI